MSNKGYVGFGFGPIQSGLLLLEAQNSGNYSRYTIAEIDQNLVDTVRGNGNAITVNIAHADRVEQRRLSGIEAYNPAVSADRKAIVSAITDADELATAIPSVALYSSGGRASVAALLAEGLDHSKPRILYASENNNYAAEILREEILKYAGEEQLRHLQILNTVIGKMSGVIADPVVMASLGLEPITPDAGKAVLVEEFNRILVSRVVLPGFHKGIEVFEEKDDLLPFEEAKLFGHNAIHALLGYLAYGKGYSVMSRVADDVELMALARTAFVNESGEALIRKHGRSGDPLFTHEGYTAYADGLLRRMTNRFLNDEVARVCRDPKRKLGYGDRICGTMREALARGVRPSAMARGALAGLIYCIGEGIDVGIPLPATVDALDGTAVRAALTALWRDEADDGRKQEIIDLVCAQVSGP